MNAVADLDADARARVFTTSQWFYGVRGVITDLIGADAFTVESARPDVARWIGFRYAAEEGYEVTWLGTRPTERGTHAAQFVGDDYE